MGAIARQKNIAVPHLDDDAHFLQSLYKYLRRIIKETTALSNYLEASLLHQEDPFIIKRLRSKIKRLETEEKEITQKILTFIKQNTAYNNDFENITSIKGVGPVAGIALFYLFLRYPDISRNKLTALCGLDPVSKTSGSSVNKKGHISKQGNKIIRSTLFMPVLCATTFNQELKTFYEHLKSNGKHSTVAQIAVMKKLILLAYSLYKNNQKYDPHRFLKYQQIKQKKLSLTKKNFGPMACDESFGYNFLGQLKYRKDPAGDDGDPGIAGYFVVAGRNIGCTPVKCG